MALALNGKRVPVFRHTGHEKRCYEEIREEIGEENGEKVTLRHRYETTEALFARDIIVWRNGRAILDVPTLSVRQGEILAVLGVNGAGKSTLLKVLALLEKPDHGDIYIGGTKAWSGKDTLSMRRRLGVVFQEPLLLRGTALYNACLGLRLRGVKRSEASRRALKWLETFDVARCAHQDVTTLSGGEAQRVSLARVFALEPEILFLDEPFSSLDPPSRAVLFKELAAVLLETGMTTVFVTHDLNEIPGLATRVIAMHEGRIILDDDVGTFSSRSPEEILSVYTGNLRTR
ncbi:MAG TPA: energy-coupling factor ABC transporter ATP-binding protein [Clostridia bacterium]|nr:energy-coupling factor ABC transporter ATP-binding protein [Clostridia bacterium]